MATPWVELELNPMSASEKAIDYGNTVKQAHTGIWLPYSYSDKPVLPVDQSSSGVYWKILKHTKTREFEHQILRI